MNSSKSTQQVGENARPVLGEEKPLDGLDLIEQAAKKVASNPTANQVDEKATIRSTERRAAPRRESACRVSVIRNDGGVSSMNTEWQFRATKIQGHAIDLSSTGMSFELDEPAALNAGDSLRVRLDNKRLDRSCIVMCEVIRVTCDDESKMRLTCRIAGRLSIDRLQEFSHLLGSNSTF